jgi:hypothetical protein
MFEENYRENIQMVQEEMPSKLNCEPQEKKTKEEKPAMVFQLTAICESSGSVSSQHSTCKKHSLCGGLHQLLYSASVLCSALVYHACSSDIHTLSKEH